MFWRRPALRAGRRLTKYHQLAFRNSSHRIGITLREGVVWGWDLMGRLISSWDKPVTWPLPTGPLYLTDTEGHSLKIRLEE